MIKNDKVDLKFIIFTTAMRILELTKLCTARVTYLKKKKKKEENKKLSNSLKIRIFPIKTHS